MMVTSVEGEISWSGTVTHSHIFDSEWDISHPNETKVSQEFTSSQGSFML